MKTKFNGILTLLLAFVVQMTFAQEKQVSGTVSDSSGPLPGVNIIVEGTTHGTETDFDGNYTLKTKKGDVLVFSFVGMETVKKTVGSSKKINVKMKAAKENVLEEVIVTATGQRKQKKKSGSAAISFKSEELTEVKLPNPMNALQGKVSGVDISGGSTPGGTQNVIIRGASSFGSNQPLYVIDGVPVTNAQNRSGDNLNSQVDFGSGMNAINPDDIADMTVLKGAAATALYGSRAANGVVMITTKSGKNSDGKINISYDGAFTVNRVGFLPEEQKIFGQGWSGKRALDENGNWGAKYDGKDRVWGHIVDNSQLIKPYKYIEDRIRNVFELGHSYKNSLSLSGGNDKTRYYFSASQNSNDGVNPTDADSYNRYTASMKGSHKGKKLSISSSVNFSTEENSAVATGQGESFFRSIQEAAGDIPLTELKDYNNKFHNLDNYFTPYGVNPYFILENNKYTQDKQKIIGNFTVAYNLLDNLSLSYTFGGDLEQSTSEVKEAVREYSKNSPNTSKASGGKYSITDRKRIQVNHDLRTMFNLPISDDIKIDYILGLNMNERRGKTLTGEINSIDVPGYYNLSNSLTPAKAYQYSYERRLIGAYINAEISMYNYLFLTLTARNDWSSTLPMKNNSFFYSGQTLAFVFSEYFKSKNIDTGILNFGKIRLAYGSTGNDASMYKIYDRYVPGSSRHPGYPKIDNLTFPIGGINSYSVSDVLGNSELKPELTSEFEVGTELEFFNKRFGIDFTYYNRFTEGLISTISLDNSSGYNQKTVNLGDVRNKGIELGVNITPIRTENFKWNINWNYTANKNNVERLEGTDEVFIAGLGGTGIYAVEGKPMGQFKSQVTRKVELNGEEHVVVGSNGQPLPAVDEKFIGKDINEKYRMGLTNTFKYKNLSLSGTLAFRNGGHFFSYTKDYMHWTGSSVESNYREPFIVPNSVVKNADGTYSENTTIVNPTDLHDYYSKGNFVGESYSIIDRSFLKLRNISLSYKMDNNFTKKLGLKSVKFSASVANILLWTPKENTYVDPEATTFGNDVSAKFGEFGALPSNESYTFGLNINL